MCDINLLCSKLKNIKLLHIENTNIDEYRELYTAYNTSISDINLLNKTINRYNRYIVQIKIWKVESNNGDICCLYIKELILLFLNETIKERTLQNFNYLIYLTEIIDSEIIKILY